MAQHLSNNWMMELTRSNFQTQQSDEERTAHKLEKERLTAELNVALGQSKATFEEMEELKHNFIHQVLRA